MMVRLALFAATLKTFGRPALVVPRPHTSLLPNVETLKMIGFLLAVLAAVFYFFPASID